ncbi:MAG: YCF48-related protein, partial [Thiohalomonadales bacterium]
MSIRLGHRLVPVHKRGYFFKIKAHRIFKAQHILICEHLKIRRNADIGEINRLWMGTRLGFFICLLFWQGLLSAAVITVEFTGTISKVTAAVVTNSFVNNIAANDVIVGTYTYETSVPATTAGRYEDAVSELYISISGKSYYWHLGNYAGKQTGVVEVKNNAGANQLSITSSESPVLAGTPLDTASPSQSALRYLQLLFAQATGSPDFLLSDALPLTMPPNSTPTSICLRFDSSPITTQCGSGAKDVSLELSVTNTKRVERFQWANPLPQGNTVSDVIWSDARKLFVAVGHNGTILSSSNGISWTNRDVPKQAEEFFSVLWGNGIFVAVAKETIYSSVNGIVWNSVVKGAAPDEDEYTKGIWDGSQFVVAGSRNSSAMLINTSPDGKAWLQSTPVGEKRLFDIAYDGTRYVAIGLDAVNRIVNSIDLKSWQKVSLPEDQTLFAIAWGNNLFVAVGVGGALLTSSNGLDWVTQTSGTSATINNIEWHGNEFVAVGVNGLVLVGDATGTTWTQTSITPISLKGNGVNGTEHIVVGDKGKIFRSRDASIWQESSSGIIENFNDVIWTGTEFIAVADQGIIAISDNGIDWIFRPSLAGQKISGVATNASTGISTHIAVGANGTVYRSVDARTAWTLTPIDNNGTAMLDDLRKVVWVEKTSQFIAIGNNGLIMNSGDGTTWTIQASGENVELIDIAVRDDFVVIVGKDLDINNAVVKTSRDGVLWQTQIIASDNPIRSLTSIAWSGNEFLATTKSAFDLLRSKDGLTWSSELSNSPKHPFANLSFVRWVGNHYMGFGIDRITALNYLFTSVDG